LLIFSLNLGLSTNRLWINEQREYNCIKNMERGHGAGPGCKATREGSWCLAARGGLTRTTYAAASRQGRYGTVARRRARRCERALGCRCRALLSTAPCLVVPSKILISDTIDRSSIGVGCPRRQRAAGEQRATGMYLDGCLMLLFSIHVN
jgi:hypothetical protein